LAIFGAVVAIGAVVLWDRGVGRALIAVPLCSSAAQLLLLVGVLRFQLYGAARRAERAGAARAGALAGDAAELERLALLGEIGATVAHEVRNPLTGIRSLAQRLGGEEALTPERRARFGALIVGEVDRLDRFVGSLLALARREPDAGARAGRAPADVAPTDVAALLDDLDALVATRAAHAGVRLAFDAGVRTVAAPRGPLAQLLLNLVLNAVAHSPAGGTVHVRVRGDATGTSCAVRDAGPGLPADAADTLFAPFAPGARGTGLGLAIVRRVADAHGWTVRARTPPAAAPASRSRSRPRSPTPGRAAAGSAAAGMPDPTPRPTPAPVPALAGSVHPPPPVR
jgi:signal transduction histidine kinase